MTNAWRINVLINFRFKWVLQLFLNLDTGQGLVKYSSNAFVQLYHKCYFIFSATYIVFAKENKHVVNKRNKRLINSCWVALYYGYHLSNVKYRDTRGVEVGGELGGLSPP